MKRIFVCVLLLLSLAASLLLPALAAPAQYTLSAKGLAFLQEFESGATADSVKNCENAVNSFAKEKNVELTQTQFDALVSITYDIGSYTLGYRYGRTIAEGGYTAAELADAWCAWVNKSNGTGFSETQLQRRLRELRLFLYDDYDGTQSELSFRYLIFKPNGGKLEDNTVLCYTAGEPYGELPTAACEGKFFAGWFTAMTDGQRIHSTMTVQENYTVYAHWSDTEPVDPEPTEPSEPTEPTEPSEPVVDPDAPPAVRTSEAGIQFIKDHEGFSRMAYWDYTQYTIGYGTRCEKDEYPDGITEEQADVLLRRMLAEEFEPKIDALEKTRGKAFSRQEYDALVSFTFNVGPGWMSSGYNIYRYVMNGGYTEMELVNCFGSWNKAGGKTVDGLAHRRIDEVNLYLNGEYSMGSTAYLYVTFRLNYDTSTVEKEDDYDYNYYKTGNPFGTLPAPSRSGYRFLGWFETATGGRKFTENSNVPAYTRLKLYAHWEEITEPEPPEDDFPFTDVPKDAWYYPAVYAVYKAGLTNGTSDTTFEPFYPFTRSMIVTMLYRMEKEPEVSIEMPFTDVRPGRFYTLPVAWAYKFNLTKGTNDGSTFEPDAYLTREQLTTMFYRYAQLKGEDVSATYDLSQYKDSEKMSLFSNLPMQWALAHGYYRVENGELRPREGATRAECMDFIARYLGLIEPYES